MSFKSKHRSLCVSRNTAKLSTFPAHQTVTCNICTGKMRLWPGQRFKWDSRNGKNSNHNNQTELCIVYEQAQPIKSFDLLSISLSFNKMNWYVASILICQWSGHQVSLNLLHRFWVWCKYKISLQLGVRLLCYQSPGRQD